MSSRRAVSWIGVAGSIALLSGCWLQPGFDAGHGRFNPLESSLTVDNVATLGQAWSVDSPGFFTSEPILSGGRVYVARATASSADVVALDAATGATVWDRVLTPDGAQLAAQQPVTFVGDELWAAWLGAGGPSCVEQVRLDPADGTVVGTDSLLATSTPVQRGSVVVQTHARSCDLLLQEGDLSVRDTATLSTSWSFTHATFGIDPTVADDQVFYQASAFALAGCGDDTCSPTWTAALGRSITDGPTLGQGGQVFYAGAPSLPGATDGQIIAVDRATGAILWRGPYGATSAQIAVDGSRVYVAATGTGAAAGTLQVFDADGCGTAVCSPLWSATVGASASLPTAGGGVVYVAGDGGVIRAYDAAGCGVATCTELTSVTVAGSVTQMSLGEGRLLATSEVTRGSLFAVTAFVAAPPP